MNIHTLAAVDQAASVAPDVRIGPFCVVEAGASIGPRCVLENHVVVKSGTSLGADNHVFEGAVLGGLPQHAHMPERPGRVLIGCGNTIRENVTIHRSLEADRATRVGDHNLLMVGAHIAHDCQLGDNVIITNNVLLAGHVSVGDRAYLSGAAAAHQFTRIGTLAMVGGQAHLNKDVPPFVTIDGLSTMVVGLNQVGLRRAGYGLAEVRQLKAAYRLIYRSALAWAEILRRLKVEFAAGPAAEFYRFLSTTTRGITPERRTPPGAVIRLTQGSQTQEQLRTKAG